MTQRYEPDFAGFNMDEDPEGSFVLFAAHDQAMREAVRMVEALMEWIRLHNARVDNEPEAVKYFPDYVLAAQFLATHGRGQEEVT